jgi:hypothetical protein
MTSALSREDLPKGCLFFGGYLAFLAKEQGSDRAFVAT